MFDIKSERKNINQWFIISRLQSGNVFLNPAVQESGTYSIGPNKHAVCSGTKGPGHCTVWEIQYRKVQNPGAPLAWIPWVPGNPSIFDQGAVHKVRQHFWGGRGIWNADTCWHGGEGGYLKCWRQQIFFKSWKFALETTKLLHNSTKTFSIFWQNFLLQISQ